tara:strand:- start:383 stop:514 length:132 start_codon:yes stop_codon:yes gene_type:complete
MGGWGEKISSNNEKTAASNPINKKIKRGKKYLYNYCCYVIFYL